MFQELMNTLAVITVVQGIILSGTLCLSKRHNKKANMFLGIFLFLFSMMILRQFSESVGIQKNILLLFNITWTIPAFYGPLLYYYVLYLLKSDKVKNLNFYTHYAIPFAYVFFLVVAYFLGIEQEEDAKKIPFMYYAYIFFQLFQIIQLFIYLVLSTNELFNYQRNLKHNYSSLNEVTLGWLMWLVSAILFLYLEWVIIFSGDLVFTNNDFPSYIIVTHRFICVVVVYLIGYFALLKPEIFIQTIKENLNSSPKKDSSFITNSKYELITLMERKKPYLNPLLTLNELANELGVHSKVASQIINDGFGKSFYDLVNEYRINEVMMNLKKSENQHLTIEAIALESGFNSTSTLNRLFKQHTNKTPRQYQSAS